MCNKFLAICVSILSIGVCPLAAQSFDPGCALPPQLDQLKQPRQIDKQCSIVSVRATHLFDEQSCVFKLNG